MSVPSPTILDWLARHTGFPGRRLATSAELLLLFAAAAGNEAGNQNATSGVVVRKDTSLMASQRHLAENRKRAHFKCDNRTAV